MKKIYLFLSSLQWGISLLLIITFLSVVGIIIPQGGMEESYFLKFGQKIGSFILFSGLNNIFSTVWYKIILLIFSFNIFLCTLNRIKKIITLFTKAKSATTFSFETLESFPIKFTFDIKETTQNLTKQIDIFFKKRIFFTSIQKSNDGNIIIVAQKRWLKEIGSSLFHFGIIPLLLGGFINQMTGFSYLQMLKENETVKVKNTPLLLKCEKFDIEKSKKGLIKDYRSSLTLFDSLGNKVKEKIIEVNNPLVYKGIKFYQSSYKIEKDTLIKNIHLLLSGKEFTEDKKNIVLKNCGDTLSVNNYIKIVVERFVPDFCLDIETKEVFSRSYEHNNPAILVTLIKNNTKLFSGWQFKNINSFHNEANKDYKISFLSYETTKNRLATGILIKKSPGNMLIWLGILFMTCGILIVFGFASPEKYIIAIVNENGSNKVIFSSPFKCEELELERMNILKQQLKKGLNIVAEVDND